MVRVQPNKHRCSTDIYFHQRLWKPKPLMFYLFKKGFILWFLLSQSSAQMNGWCGCYIELTVTTLAHIMRLRPFVKQVTRSTRAGRLLGGPVNTKHWGLKWEKFRIRNGTSLLTHTKLASDLLIVNSCKEVMYCQHFFEDLCIFLPVREPTQKLMDGLVQTYFSEGGSCPS